VTYLVTEFHIPKLPRLHKAKTLNGEIAPRPERLDALEHGPLITSPPGVHEAPDIPLRLPAQRQKRLGLGGDQQPPVHDGPEQRLHPVAVPRGDKQLAPLIVQHEGELAAQVTEEGQAVVLVERDDDLTVAAALERVRRLLEQVGADAVIVVQFAIDHGVHRTGRVVEGLGAVGAQVVDRQADVAESCEEGVSVRSETFAYDDGVGEGGRTNSAVSADPLAARIRTTMLDELEGGVELFIQSSELLAVAIAIAIAVDDSDRHGLMEVAMSVEGQDATDATHLGRCLAMDEGGTLRRAMSAVITMALDRSCLLHHCRPAISYRFDKRCHSLIEAVCALQTSVMAASAT